MVWISPQNSFQIFSQSPTYMTKVFHIYISSLLQPAGEVWYFEPLWPLLAAINSNSAGGWITFDTRLAVSLHILSLSQMLKSGCVKVMYANVSQSRTCIYRCKTLCRTLFWIKNNKYLSLLVHFKLNAVQNYLYDRNRNVKHKNKIKSFTWVASPCGGIKI